MMKMWYFQQDRLAHFTEDPPITGVPFTTLIKVDDRWKIDRHSHIKVEAGKRLHQSFNEVEFDLSCTLK
jgi:hypothetical protein